ncbi:MAG: hypothetical protein WBC74_04900, partial [Candidatus Omnitrophota bacterium]
RMLTEVDKTYPEILESSKERTLKTVKTTKKEYDVIQGKKVFLERMRQLLRLTPLEGFRSIDTPLVIIYGKKDRFCPLSYVRDIEKTLNQAELRQFSTVSFRGLGHFFGEVTGGGDSQKRYKVNAEVLETIKYWIEQRCISPADNS